jgi:Flp pilus assembly protein TadD
MAGTLLMFFPFILAAFRKSDGRLKKTIFSIHLVILIVLLLFTQSRGAMLGMVVMSLFWLLWGRIPIRRILPFIIIFSLAVVLITLIIGLSLSDLSNWLSTIDASSKHGDAPPTSWITRMEIWRVASRMLADYPVVGSGLYTFDPVSRANYVYKTILPNFNLTHAHNLFLQTGTSLGIGGLLALVGIWTTILVRLWKTSHSENEQIRHLSAVFAASVTGYLFFNLYDTITFGQKPGLYVWIILAGSVGLSQLAQEQATANHPASDKQSFFSVGKLISFAPLLTLIILLLSPAFPRNLANLKLDRAFLQSKTLLTVTAANFSTDARRAGLAYYLAGNDVQALNTWQHDPQGAAFLQSQGVIALMSGKIVSAISWFTLALELAPNSAEIYMWRGMANEERGMLSMAEADFRKAAEFTDSSMLSTETKAYIFYRLGCVLASKHNWPDAAGAFAQAASLEPETSIYYQRLGDALFELGDPAAAETAYERAEQ